MTAKEREKQVIQAIANERLEGLNVSEEAQEIFDDYITGKMTAEEAAEQVFRRYGVA